MRITNTILSEPLGDEEDQPVEDSTSEEDEHARTATEAQPIERRNGHARAASGTGRTVLDGRIGDRAVITEEDESGDTGHVLSSSATMVGGRSRSRYRARIRKLIEESKSKKTPRLILQIWQSDYSIIAFALVIASFYLMKDARYPPIGVLFFVLAMATVDAILSIFVVRLSFHQNKHGFYRTEDFERDWLRYRILLSMTKAALLFLVATTCGTAAVIGSYIVWFFTSTQRLRYFILRWSMDDHYPELQRWSIFTLLKEFGIEPKLRNFNFVAVIGLALGFAVAFVF